MLFLGLDVVSNPRITVVLAPVNDFGILYAFLPILEFGNLLDMRDSDNSEKIKCGGNLGAQVIVYQVSRRLERF